MQSFLFVDMQGKIPDSPYFSDHSLTTAQGYLTSRKSLNNPKTVVDKEMCGVGLDLPFIQFSQNPEINTSTTILITYSTAF